MAHTGDSFPDRRYPARCRPATHTTGSLPTWAQQVRLHGRLLSLQKERGWLADGDGTVGFRTVGKIPAVPSGDIVSVEGHVEAGELVVERIRVLAPAAVPWRDGGDWDRFNQAEGRIRKNLQVRAAVLRAIREFFAARGFLEVETPALVVAPGQEAHLRLFQTEFCGVRKRVTGYLVPSPEHHMKRLLGSGFDRIFQICRCFRNSECAAAHNPEFTMLEWYRAYAGYEEVMRDVEELVVHAAREVRGSGTIGYQGRQLDLEIPWHRLTVEQAFRECAGIELRQCETAERFRVTARSLGYESVAAEDEWEDIFFKVLIEKVEPALEQRGAVFIKDYPAGMAALAKLRADDPAVAERVEAYVGGLELANGFTELNDPREQRARFLSERQKRLRQGYPLHPLDEDFLETMARAMPPAGGMALGVDRLAMLLVDAATIDEVIAFPFAC